MRGFGRLVTVAALCAGAALWSPAYAQPGQEDVVSDQPVQWTPHVMDGTVRAIAQVGDVIVVGGTFTAVTDPAAVADFARDYLFAFKPRTGEIQPLDVPLDGPVYALAAGPPGTVFLGGTFHHAGGQPHDGIARLDVATGRIDPAMTADITGTDVRTLAFDGMHLFAGGLFSAINGVRRPGLAGLDPESGAVDPAFDPQLRPWRSGPIKIEALALTPDHERLIAIGGFGTVDGLNRPQVAVFTTGGDLTDWRTSTYNQECASVYDDYVRAVDVDPTGAYAVITTTGHTSTPTAMCDTAARFELSPGPHKPTWVNHTGGNSLFAVACTGAAVYVGGHQQWLDNPYGNKNAGPGAVARPGIGAIDPDTGLALAWNPTRTRGVGVQAFLVTPDGLYVGSDTDQLAHEYHGRIGLFPNP
ncbi:hypothetical protein [Hamadaea tsunoensis]|uniref:hypothetical protein n=1 Tax=Hamadaea tsunoensis TaxID=53368 RepID=UPI0004264157|nr:hypothetical protein [Hamadaea tsunoensis]